MKNNMHNKKKQRTKIQIFVRLSLLGIFLFLIYSIIFQFYPEKKSLITTDKNLDKKIEYEKQRLQQLSEYKEYMKTDEYVEDVASSDLGMIYDGEVIFKSNN